MKAQANNLRVWLARYKPTTLRVATPGGEREISCAGKWSESAKTALAMQATKLEALDSKGKVIAYAELEAIEDEEMATRAPAVVPTTALQSDLLVVSQLLANAYRHSTDVAFTQMCEIMRIAFQRLDKVETVLQRTTLARLNQRVSSGRKDEDEESDGINLETILGTIIQGKIAASVGHQAPVANGAAPSGEVE
jgi:hypothetical protein